MGPLNRAFAETWITGDRLLPPCLRLHAVRQAIRSAQIWRSAHITSESVRPACIGQEGAQYRPAEELSSCSDLRRDCKFAQPAIEMVIAVLRKDKAICVVESTLERQGDIPGEKDLWSRAKRHP